MFLSDFGLARDAQERALTKRGDFLSTIRYLGDALVYDLPVEVSTQRPEWAAPPDRPQVS